MGAALAETTHDFKWNDHHLRTAASASMHAGHTASTTPRSSTIFVVSKCPLSDTDVAVAPAGSSDSPTLDNDKAGSSDSPTLDNDKATRKKASRTQIITSLLLQWCQNSRIFCPFYLSVGFTGQGSGHGVSFYNLASEKLCGQSDWDPLGGHTGDRAVVQQFNRTDTHHRCSQEQL